MDIRCISDERAALGESPVWSAAEGCVYWIDIRGKKLHRTDPAAPETRTWALPSHPGMIALRRQGGLVVALEGGLYGFDPRSGRFDFLVRLEPESFGNRPNDGKCDAAGRLWIGTMNMTDAGRATGAFYCVDADLTVTRIEDGFQVPNGLAWSPDDRIMYHTDTRSNVVRAFTYDPATGKRSAEHPFFRFDRAKTGGVDGAAMDVEGGYWAALYGGGKLIRVTPAGEIDREIPLPVTQPTMPAFGGADMRTLFVTSATQRLDDAALRAQPLAGGLFIVPAGIAGHPVHPFGG
jgi:sugar lactone lactonase YvrE